MKTLIKNNTYPIIATLVIAILCSLVIAYVVNHPVESFNHFIK